MIDSQDLNADELVAAKLTEGLVTHGPYEIMSSQKGRSTVADDIKKILRFGQLFSHFWLSFLYILLRFRKWQFSLGAVAAVFHDVMIVLSMFSIFRNFTILFRD